MSNCTNFVKWKIAVRLILLFFLNLLLSSCFNSQDRPKEHPDLIKVEGYIDPNLSVYGVYLFQLTRDKFKCKRIAFNLFSSGDTISFVPEIRSATNQPFIDHDRYRLSMDFSEMEEYSSCRPRLEQVKLCFYQRYSPLSYSRSSTRYGDKLTVIQSGPHCTNALSLYFRNRSGNIFEGEYNAGTIYCDDIHNHNGCRFIRNESHADADRLDSYRYDIVFSSAGIQRLYKN